MAWTVGAMVMGAGLHPLLQAARRNGWLAFVDTSPERFYDSLLSFEAAAEAEELLGSAAGGAGCREEPPLIEEPEEVPPEDYKVGRRVKMQHGKHRNHQVLLKYSSSLGTCREPQLP